MIPEAYTIPFLLIMPAFFALGLLLPIPILSTRKGAWVYSATTSTLSFCFMIYVAFKFNWADPGSMQFVGEIPWIPGWDLGFNYGLDGMSIWLVMLTTFLMPIVVLGSLVEVKGDMRTFHFWLHILEAALIGTFIARDMIFFYVCFEFTLIPLFFLIGIFGHGEKLKAARVFFFYTFTASLLTMAGILYVAWFNTTLTVETPGLTDVYDTIQFDITDPHFEPTSPEAASTEYAQQNYAGHWTFNIKALWAAGRMMPFEAQLIVMLAFLAGFGVKTPLFPFHTWLPLAHTEAPTAGSVDLAGLVLKLGPYGLLRLAIPMLPLAAITLAPWLGALAVIGVIYAALICWVQTDAKKLIAYSSVSHMGFCILGLFAFDGTATTGSVGATGAFIYMLSHGLATGGMFLCIGMLYDRFHTREINRMSGLAKIMPAWAFFFCLFAFASVGLPGLNGFIGEFLTMIGTFNSREVNGSPILGPWYAILAATGVILAAIYLLFLVGKIVFGPLNLPHWEDTGEQGIGGGHDLSYREAMTLVPIAVICVAIGLFPYPILRSLEPAIQNHTRYVHDEIDKMEAEAKNDAEPLDEEAASARGPITWDSRHDEEIESDALNNKAKWKGSLIWDEGKNLGFANTEPFESKYSNGLQNAPTEQEINDLFDRESDDEDSDLNDKSPSGQNAKEITSNQRFQTWGDVVRAIDSGEIISNGKPVDELSDDQKQQYLETLNALHEVHHEPILTSKLNPKMNSLIEEEFDALFDEEAND